MNDNKKIALNTIVLYIKLGITIVLNFILSRLVLDALGASDYGLYNVVGGIVAMLNIMGTSMVSTSYRYLAVEIGKGKEGNPNRVYNTVMVIHLAIAFLLLFVGSIVGLFYVDNYLNVLPERVADARFLLIVSLITASFSVISIPSNGLIIAREKFLFTSIVEIVVAVLKVILVIALLFYSGNRLRLYAIFLAFCTFLQPLCYQIYCRVKDKNIVAWKLNKVKTDYIGVGKFAWWIFLGAAACNGRIQGAAMIINYFFGTVINASFGLASQVYAAISHFTATLRQAAIPQIMKSQGGGDEQRSLNIVYKISKFSFLSMFILAMPVLFTIDNILKIWLNEPPLYTNYFVIFLIINGMVANLGAGFDASIQATGRIKLNQIGYTIINLSLLPIIYILYKIGFEAYWNIIVMIGLSLTTLIFQIYIMKRITSFGFVKYLNLTISPCLLTVIVSVVPVLLVAKFVNQWIIRMGVVFLIACLAVYTIGLTKKERLQLSNTVKNYCNKMIRR